MSSCVNSGVRVQFGGETSMQIDLHVNLEKLEHEHQAENSPPCVSTVPTVPQCSQSRLLNYDWQTREYTKVLNMSAACCDWAAVYWQKILFKSQM